MAKKGGSSRQRAARSRSATRRQTTQRTRTRGSTRYQAQQRQVRLEPGALAFRLTGIADIVARCGLSPGAALLGATAWLVALLLWVAGAVSGGFAVFLGTLLCTGVATGWLVAGVVRGKGVLRGARAGLVVALAAFVPVVFDPHTVDVFNLPKYTLVVIGALALTGLSVVEAVHLRRPPLWRNGLQWLLAAVVAWTAVAVFTGVDVHVGLLGDYGSYDGLYLALATGVVMMSAAEAFDLADVPKVLGALGFSGASVVVLYGLLQLHDVELRGPRWDFIHWGNLGFNTDIFSTLGNPNHLGGYLAIILPVVVVLGLGARRWLWRIASAGFGVVVLVEILRTSARGSWVAVIASGLVLALCLAPELRRRPLLGGVVAGAVVVAAAAGMAVVGRHFLGHPLSTLFQSGGMSSVEQRFQLWGAAVQIAVHHPLTGIGPDSFALVWPQHQNAAWVAALGPDYLVNGAHDIFMNILADQGFVGLLLFVAILAWAGLRTTGAWRRLRAVERSASAEDPAGTRAHSGRILLAIVAASITAYVVQAIFNVQQVALTFEFWLLVGLLMVACRAAAVPATLRPAVLVSSTEHTSDPGAEQEIATGQRRAASRNLVGRGVSGRTSTPPWLTALAGAVVLAAVVVVGLGADGPYRADHAYWAAGTELHGSTQGTSTPTSSAAVSAAYFRDIAQAETLNPWEARYPASEGSFLASAEGHATGATALRVLILARHLWMTAVTDEPLWAGYSYGEAVVDGVLASADKAAARRYLADEVAALRMALADNPRDTQYQALLGQTLAAERSAGGGA